MRRTLSIALFATALALPLAARAQQQPIVQPHVEAKDVDANVGSQTDRPPGGAPADRRGSLENERMRSADANADFNGVVRAYQLDAFQRELARVAEHRGSTPEVKQLASRIYNNAGEADEALRGLAKELQMRKPEAGMTPDQSARVEELKKAPRGAELDKRLVDTMMSAQRQELDLLDDMLARQPDDHARWLIDRAARSMRESSRAAGIERKTM